MRIVLQSIPFADLQVLAAGGVPAAARHCAQRDALPPDFVAARSVAQLQQGKPAHWCATFYIVAPDLLNAALPCIVGSCGFKDVPVDGRVEIGYGVSPARQRRSSSGR